MTALISLYTNLTNRLAAADWLIPTLARFVFAAVLLVYFLNSGMTKLGDGISGIWSPSAGAYDPSCGPWDDRVRRRTIAHRHLRPRTDQCPGRLV